MRIPNADRAVIDPVKLHGYLLSGSHPVGRFKAAFFHALGYSSENWHQLEADLRSQHLSRDATREDLTRHGQKYVIRGNPRYSGWAGGKPGQPRECVGRAHR